MGPGKVLSPPKVEPEYAAPYAAWREKPGPETAGPLLEAVKPLVDRAVAIHVGPSGPLISSRARRMALDGLKRYDPAAGPLRPYLTQHLAGLKRVNRQQTTVLKVPERVSLDRYHLSNLEKGLEDELGRPPSDGELADRTGFSLARVRKARSYRPAVVSGALEDLLGGSVPEERPVGPRGLGAWEKLVYDELSHRDQRIVDLHRAGLENKEIAARLGVTPGAVSQRKAYIQGLLDDAEGLSPFG